MISEITRRDIFDLLRNGIQTEDDTVVFFPYYGRLSEIEFLERIFDLKTLPSSDYRYHTAKDDIHKHTVLNNDWAPGWVFSDERFGLNAGNDEVLLRFICEVLHPAVRPKGDAWEYYYNEINSFLKTDGYELYPAKKVSGRSVLGWRRVDSSSPIAILPDLSQCVPLGQGGYGVVYKYHNDAINMDFAIKIYHPLFATEDQREEGEKRFFREAKILFSLESRNISRVYDVGRASDGQPYIKMEYIDGCNLRKYYEEHGKLNWEECILIIREVINGISCAHHNDIIHRDLRPENVLCSFDKKTVKVIDFGISAFIDIENHTRLTRTGEYPAGGSFADPALAENPKLRDCRSDIYSIGGLMFYLLSGRNPSGSDMKRVLQTSNTGLSNEHVDIVMKCLSSNIEDRYTTCEELLAAINNAQSH